MQCHLALFPHEERGQSVLSQEGSSREVPGDPVLPQQSARTREALPSQHHSGVQISLPRLNPPLPVLTSPASVSEHS